MKYVLFITFFVNLFLVSCTCSRKNNDSVALDEKKRSYYVGVGLAQSVEQDQGYDMDEVLAGFKDALQGGDVPSKEELQKFYLEEQQRRYQKQNVTLIKNEAAATAYLTDVAKKESLIVTGSGVYYKVLKTGDGNAMGASDRATIKLKGSLPDGTVFEDAQKNPKSVTLMEVVPGLRTISGLLKEGAQITVYLSPQQAYGPQGKGAVPAMSAVKFDIEVVQIQRQQQKKLRL